MLPVCRKRQKQRNCDRIYDRLYRGLCSGHADVAFHHFGGITEDIACFFVQVCEIMMPLVVLLTSIATRLDIAGEL